MNHTIKAAALVTAALLAGCTTNPQTGNYEINRTGVGLAVGTAAGAAVGAAKGNGSYSNKGAMIGAAIGGGTGYYLEKKHQELQASLRNTELQLEKAHDDKGNEVLVISAPSDVAFAVGSSDISAQAYRGLSTLANSLKDQKYRVAIVGHTDNTGRYDANKKLSYERARSVAEYLHNSGVQTENLFIRGAGPDEPKADNKTPAGRAENRRVEIVLSTATA